MRILIAHTKKYNSFLGGIETYEKNLIGNLIGHHVFASFPDLNLKKKKKKNNLTFLPYADPLIGKEQKHKAINLHIKNFKERIAAEIKENDDFDLIICLHSIFPNICSKISNANIIFVLPSLNKIYFEKIRHKLSAPEKKWWHQALKIEKDIFSNPRVRVVVLSKMVLRLVKKIYNVRTSTPIVISPGVKINTLKKFRKKIDVLTVCRISEEKNLSSLINVAKFLPGRVFYIVGDGPELPSLKDAKEKDKIANVFFTGAKTNPLPYYKKSKIFVLPSKYESFGLVLLEAMASGLPCIAFEPDGGKIETASNEIIENGKNGFLVKDEKEMAEKIDFLLKNEKIRTKMGITARKTAKKYSWKKCANEILKFAKIN